MLSWLDSACRFVGVTTGANCVFRGDRKDPRSIFKADKATSFHPAAAVFVGSLVALLETEVGSPLLLFPHAGIVSFNFANRSI